MTESTTGTVIKERELPHTPENVWRALTETRLIDKWLMETDFRLEVGHRFDFHAEWGTIICEVLAFEPYERLVYSWKARGLNSVVTWTLTKTDTGTHLRLEQTGFDPDQQMAYRGANLGWNRFLHKFESVLSNPDRAMANWGSAS